MTNQEQKIQGLTEKELKWSFWFVTHKILLLRILKFFLIILNVIIWGYVVFGLVDFYLIKWQRNQALIRDLSVDYVNYQYFREINKPKDLEISNIQTFNLGDNRYDFIAQVVNPNENWTVRSLSYSFDFPNREEREIKQIFILPGQKKYLIDLAVSSQKPPTDLNLKIQEVDWQRVYQYQDLKAEVLNFSVFDIKFISAKELATGRLPISKTEFTVKNRSAYNFWDVGFYIILHRGPKVVGLTYIIKEDFQSGETQKLGVSWYQRISAVDKVEVIPDVNILDPSVYRRAEAGSGEAK